MKKKNISLSVLTSFFTFLGSVSFFAGHWFKQTYGDVGFDSILFTLFSDLHGTDRSIVQSYLREGLLPAVFWSVVVSCFLLAQPKRKLTVGKRNADRIENDRKTVLYPFRRGTAALLAAILCVSGIVQAVRYTDLVPYLSGMLKETNLYDLEYVDPASVKIRFPKEKRNLIYIFLESMEVSYMSREKGGGQDYDLIPELYELAEKNINFSQNDGFGGGRDTTGTSWTVGAMVAQSSGTPLSIPLSDPNTYGDYSRFLPGVISIHDILNENGYCQELLLGTDALFGGRINYFTQHGVERIKDLATAREEGIVEENYWNGFWGMDDFYLFEYAKKELTELASGDEPFALTMLTVDTHFQDGYRCPFCPDVYPLQYDNAIACSSKLVYLFLEWIQSQDFYENTTVIISGDHETMRTEYIDDGYTRRIYNCILNAAAEPVQEKNREFTTMDMFPTTLAAMGCSIEGDRLGLGTNLFSDQITLTEKYGYETLDTELGKTSFYYQRELLYGTKRYCIQ